MKNKSLIITVQLIALFLVMFQISGCKKSSNDPAPSVLVSGTWTLDELLIDGAPYTGSISEFSLTLTSNNTYSLTDVDGSQINGDWSLTNGDTILKLDAEEYVIVTLTTQNAEVIGTSRSDKTGTRELTYRLSKVN